MAIGLNPQLKARLREQLRAVLERAQVQDGIFLEYDLHELLEPLNASVPRSGSVHEALVRYISEEPVSDFIFGELAHRLYRRPLEEGTLVPLLQLDEFQDADVLAHDLIEQLDGLPRRYTITLPLPEGMMALFDDAEGSVMISEGMHIRNDLYLACQYEPSIAFSTEGNPFAGISCWPAARPFLQFEFEGFVARYTKTASHSDALDGILAVMGSMVAHGLLLHDPYTHDRRKFRCEVPVHHEGDMPRRILQGGALPSDLEQLVCQLSVPKKESTEAWRKRARLELVAIGKMMRGANQSLRLGCKWLFSSYSGDDQLLNYVKAAVVLETLLGEKTQSEQVGLGVLLGNRCAYLIAESAQERHSLLEDFRKIYEIRSKIVHRGKSRLSRTETNLYYRLLWLGHRVIRRETALIRA